MRRDDLGASRQRGDRAIAARRQRRRDIGEAPRLERIAVSQIIRQERAVKGVAGPGGVKRFDRESGEALALGMRGDQRALLAQRQRDDFRAEPQIEVGDGVGRGQSGEFARIVEARQRDIGIKHGFVDDRPRARQRPQFQPQIGVVGNQRLVFARDGDGGENRIGRRGRYRLADARGVQYFRRGDHLRGDVRFAQPACGGAGASIRKLVALVAMRHEIDAGVGRVADDHAAAIDALARPQIHEVLAKRIGADGSEIACAGAAARRRDHRVGRIAAKAGRKRAALRRLVEFDHGFADGDDVRHGA